MNTLLHKNSPTSNAVQLSKRKTALQTKLTINTPGDVYEQEADAMAERVMRMRDNETLSHPITGLIGFSVQRKCAACEEEEKQRKTVMRKAENAGGGFQASTSLISSLNASKGGGSPLPPTTKGIMENAFSADFSGVRIHTDSRASEMNKGISAKAFTNGNDIYFRGREFAPDNFEGQKLLAHELTHVVQQGKNLAIQRQSIDDDELPRFDPHAADQDQLSLPDPDIENFQLFNAQDTTHLELDADCPRTPTHLGEVEPDPECPIGEEDFDGKKFNFCKGSDILSPAEQVSDISTFARNQPAFSTFKLAGYSSQEGTSNQNVNLACHRAKRVARILLNAGVRPERLQIFNRGVTTRFGSGNRERNLRNNRAVVINVDVQPQAALSQTLPTDPQALVDLARNKLLQGEYQLGADSYISFWTCGHVPSIARAVEQSTILIEGQPNVPSITRRTIDPNIGVVESRGLNTINLSRELFQAFNPLECIIARIIDLAFHHAVRPQIPDFRQQHAAGLYCARLAGFGACLSITSGLVNGSLTTIAGQSFPDTDPPVTDPRQDMHPPCANQALPGFSGIGGNLTTRRIPAFTVDNFEMNGSNAVSIITIQGSGNRERIDVSSPDRFLSGSATVRASGNPADISNYSFGFIQTLVEDTSAAEYVSGHQIRFTMPTPLLDGPPRSFAGANRPWFEPRLIRHASTLGGTTLILDSPHISFPFNYLNVENSVLEPIERARPSADVQRGNVINRAHIHQLFHTWLVARRNDAPLDIFSTHFIRGRSWSLDMNADVTGHSASGTASLQVSPLFDHSQMQMQDPVPNDINRISEIISYSRPVDRAQAAGLPLSQYVDEIRRIASPLRVQHGLVGSTITIRIKIDRQTGRVRLDTDRTRAVEVETNSGTESSRVAFRVALFDIIRKDMVLAPLPGRSSVLETVPVTMSATSA